MSYFKLLGGTPNIREEVISSAPESSSRHEPEWIPPPVQTNVDTATGKKDAKGVVAVVVRNREGEFVGASSITFDGITDPRIVMALACRDLLLCNFIISSDCLQVIKALEDCTGGAYVQIIQEINAASASLESASFVHDIVFLYF